MASQHIVGGYITFTPVGYIHGFVTWCFKRYFWGKEKKRKKRTLFAFRLVQSAAPPNLLRSYGVSLEEAWLVAATLSVDDLCSTSVVYMTRES